MATQESISKYVVKDQHGNIKERGAFSVVSAVHVELHPGVGEPSAESRYVNGELFLDFYNLKGEAITGITYVPSQEDGGENYIKITTDAEDGENKYTFPIRNGRRGNGITSIETDEQDGDGAINTVIFKTTDNQDGTLFHVRNGSRGNGIASSSEELSPNDGGTNSHFIMDDDGNKHVFHTKNGKTGAQGDSVLVGQGDLPLAHVLGQDNTKAMSQKGVTDAINEVKNEVKDSAGDLDFADENGHVIMRCEEGHVRTKNFDSSKVNSEVSQAHESVDFEIADENDNVILKLRNGHIKTKKFDSDNIEEGIKYWKGKVMSILGDSISTFGVPDQNNATGTWTYPGNRCRYPQSSLFTDVSKQYWYKLKEKLGLELGINESWAGSRISNTSATDTGDVGPNRHMASMTRIGHLGENGTPDLIIVYGGTNDAGYSVAIGTFNTENPASYTEEQIAALPVATFADAYRTMLIRLQYYYPNAKIICLFPNYTSSYYTITNLDKYEEVIREACDFFGVEYLDLRTCGVNIYNKSTYLPDGIHPNPAGMDLIYRKLSNFLIYK